MHPALVGSKFQPEVGMSEVVVVITALAFAGASHELGQQ
jgi:hypothetical protein